MDALRGVKLTDTNLPCGLTIDSFCSTEMLRVVEERNYRLQGIQLSQLNRQFATAARESAT